jgi:hypothetical protein
MATTATTDLNGLFKQAYADKIENLIPDESLLTRAIKFQGRDKMLGNQYNQPVIVRSEQGFTYSRPNNGTPNLNPASSMKTQNAVVDGFIIVEQSGISYEAVARSDNVNSFRNAVDLVMGDAMESFGRRLEISLLYGQSPTGLGLTTNTATNVDTTHTTFPFATGQWAAGLWTPLEGASLDVYNSSGVALNTTGPVIVSSINITAKTITVSAATGDITAIDAYLNGTGTGAVLRFYSAGTNGLDEAIGLDAIMLNTGIMFGIDASVYSLWEANTYNVGSAAFVLSKIQAGLSVACSRGLSEDVCLYVNPYVWQELSTEEVAFRRLDSSYSSKKVQNGFETLEFYSQNGKVSVYAHKYVKEGEAFLLPTDRAVRIGSSDISFNIPGTDNGQIFIQNPTSMGFTFRIFSQQSLLVTKPAVCVKFYNIV